MAKKKKTKTRGSRRTKTATQGRPSDQTSTSSAPARSGRGRHEKGAVPSYIVVFKEHADEECVNRCVHKATNGRVSKVVENFSFDPEDEAVSVSVEHQYTNRTKSLSATLSRREASALNMLDDVDIVVRNEFRVPIGERERDPQPGSGGGGRGDPQPPDNGGGPDVQPTGVAFGHRPRDPQPSSTGGGRCEYLRGFRDAADAVYHGVCGDGPAGAAPAGPTPADVGDGLLTYGLQLLGIRDGSPYTGRGVRVAVLDTGIDVDHPDFRNRFASSDRLADFTDSGGPADDVGHGTHCAGTVGGPLESIGGMRYGVAPKCDLFVGKVMTRDGGWDHQILRGIEWALFHKARVISMSLGSIRAVDGPAAKAYEIIARRHLHRKDGTLFVAATGNDSRSPVSNPAAGASFMAVGAIDRNVSLASFSNVQRDGIGLVNLVAPGVDVYSSLPGGRFARWDGTSMATPHVAGAAALWIEADADDLETPRQVWDRLEASARCMNMSSCDVGRGLVQAPR